MDAPADSNILLPAEAAALFGVRTETIARWAAGGKLPRDCWFKTPASRGHYRYYRQRLIAFRDGSNG